MVDHIPLGAERHRVLVGRADRDERREQAIFANCQGERSHGAVARSDGFRQADREVRIGRYGLEIVQRCRALVADEEETCGIGRNHTEVLVGGSHLHDGFLGK